MVALARKTLLHEWRRFLPAVLAVGFAGLLQLLQAALVLGIFSSASIYVTGSTADLWVGYPGTQSVSLGASHRAGCRNAPADGPEVVRVEPFQWVDADWRGPRGSGGESIYVTGIDTRADAMAYARIIAPEQRMRLAEPDAVIVDRADIDKRVRVGDAASVNGHRVRVVGVGSGLRAWAASTCWPRWKRRAGSPRSRRMRTSRLICWRNCGIRRRRGVAARLGGSGGFGPYEVWTAGRVRAALGALLAARYRGRRGRAVPGGHRVRGGRGHHQPDLDGGGGRFGA
jgi:putative ABC transport system permease protein